MPRHLWLGVLLSLLLGMPASAQPPPPSQAKPPELVPAPVPVQPGWVARGVAVVQALDKVYARTTALEIKRGETARYGAIDIAVLACFARPPDQAPDAAAFLAITEPASGKTLFRGWMFANNPALSMLEHPIYDVRITACRS